MAIGGLTAIGRYEVLAMIGRGAMGVVYKAKDPKLDRIVAIKVIRGELAAGAAEEAELRDRFEREARALARLGQNPHPHIVGIFDMGELDGAPYLVMEYVDGTSLEAALRKGERFGVERSLTIALQMCSALEYMHTQQILHRDIKPANVLLTTDRTAKLTDFGIARVGQSTMTQTGQHLGTPSYMSPEQFQSQDPDPRSDIFSLGVVLYELLTGDRAFPGESTTAIQHRVLNDNPPPPTRLNAHLSGVREIDELIAKALAKRPSHRFRNAREFAEAIRGCLAALGSADKTQLGPRATDRDGGRTTLAGAGLKLVERHRSAAIIAGIVVVITASLAGYYVSGIGRPDRGSGQSPTAVATPPAPRSAPLSPDSKSPDAISTPTPEHSREESTGPGRAPTTKQEKSSIIPGRSKTPSGQPPPSVQLHDPLRPPDSSSGPSPARSTAAGSGSSSNLATGLLNINASPWAYVEIDGRKLSDTTPLKGVKLEPGTHQVTVFRDGFKRETRTVEVRSGQQEYVSFDLKPQ